MNSEDFVNEVKNSGLCPANFDEMYSVFKIAQEETLKTLKEFHRVCENHGIDYQVTYGSLIGLIRDGGMIPWDYDVDVFVPFNQKAKLIDALKCDLDSNYYFYCPEINPSCRHFIMRVAPKQYRTELLHVDVFYYVGTSNDEKLRREHISQFKRVARARYSKLVNAKEESMGSLKKYFSLLYHKIPYIFTSVKEIAAQYNSLCNKYLLEDFEIYLEADSFADYCSLTRELMKETHLIKVDDGEFRIPVHYDGLLRSMYGDYMILPPLENRINEVKHYYERYQMFGNNLNFHKEP